MGETRAEGQAPLDEPDHAANGTGEEAASYLLRAGQAQDFAAFASEPPPADPGDTVGSSDGPMEPEASILLRESSNGPMGDAPGTPAQPQETFYVSSLGILVREQTGKREGSLEADLSPDKPYARVVEGHCC